MIKNPSGGGGGLAVAYLATPYILECHNLWESDWRKHIRMCVHTHTHTDSLTHFLLLLTLPQLDSPKRDTGWGVSSGRVWTWCISFCLQVTAIQDTPRSPIKKTLLMIATSAMFTNLYVTYKSYSSYLLHEEVALCILFLIIVCQLVVHGPGAPP